MVESYNDFTLNDVLDFVQLVITVTQLQLDAAFK